MSLSRALKFLAAALIITPSVNTQNILPNIGTLPAVDFSFSSDDWRYQDAKIYETAQSGPLSGKLLISTARRTCNLLTPNFQQITSNTTLQIIFLPAQNFNFSVNVEFQSSSRPYSFSYSTWAKDWQNERFSLPAQLQNLLPGWFRIRIQVPARASPVMIYHVGLGEKSKESLRDDVVSSEGNIISTTTEKSSTSTTTSKNAPTSTTATATTISTTTSPLTTTASPTSFSTTSTTTGVPATPQSLTKRIKDLIDEGLEIEEIFFDLRFVSKDKNSTHPRDISVVHRVL
jgi:hypothetical protein